VTRRTGLPVIRSILEDTTEELRVPSKRELRRDSRVEPRLALFRLRRRREKTAAQASGPTGEFSLYWLVIQGSSSDF